jgi:hypothetical protein
MHTTKVVDFINNSLVGLQLFGCKMYSAVSVEDEPEYYYFGDILVESDMGRKFIELKVEDYSAIRGDERFTPNFAIELYSCFSCEKPTLGTIMTTKSDWYATYYTRSGHLFIYPTVWMRAYIFTNSEKCKKVKPRSSVGGDSLCMLVKRKSFKSAMADKIVYWNIGKENNG